MSFIIRVLINAVGLWVATYVVNQVFPGGITIGSQNFFVTLLVVAVIFGLVNAVIKPLLAMATCPLYVLTLGLFTFIVNALMLLLTSFIATAVGYIFQVNGFGPALLGAIVISVVSFILSIVVKEERGRARARG